MKKIITLIGIALISTLSLQAQKVTLTSGEASALKGGAKSMLVRYDYSTMGVGEFSNEKDYVDQKVAELNEKENRKGDKWLKAWEGSRKTKYQPKFEELFNKVGEKKNISISKNSKKPKYILVVKTVFTEPGFNIGIMKKPSLVSFEFVVKDAVDTNNVVAEFALEKVKGAQAAGFDYDPSSRIAESYAKAGKIFGKYLAKNIK